MDIESLTVLLDYTALQCDQELTRADFALIGEQSNHIISMVNKMNIPDSNAVREMIVGDMKYVLTDIKGDRARQEPDYANALIWRYLEYVESAHNYLHALALANGYQPPINYR